jgi:hypothetical protein
LRASPSQAFLADDWKEFEGMGCKRRRRGASKAKSKARRRRPAYVCPPSEDVAKGCNLVESQIVDAVQLFNGWQGNAGLLR